MFEKIKSGVKSACSFVQRHALAVCGAVGGALGAAGLPSPAHAVALLDTTTAANSITAELTPAITAAMPIAGTIIAVTVGWKMFKRFTH